MLGDSTEQKSQPASHILGNTSPDLAYMTSRQSHVDRDLLVIFYNRAFSLVKTDPRPLEQPAFAFLDSPPEDTMGFRKAIKIAIATPVLIGAAALAVAIASDHDAEAEDHQKTEVRPDQIIFGELKDFKLTILIQPAITEHSPVRKRQYRVPDDGNNNDDISKDSSSNFLSSSSQYVSQVSDKVGIFPRVLQLIRTSQQAPGPPRYQDVPPQHRTWVQQGVNAYDADRQTQWIKNEAQNSMNLRDAMVVTGYL